MAIEEIETTTIAEMARVTITTAVEVTGTITAEGTVNAVETGVGTAIRGEMAEVMATAAETATEGAAVNSPRSQ